MKNDCFPSPTKKISEKNGIVLHCSKSLMSYLQNMPRFSKCFCIQHTTLVVLAV